MPPITTSRDPVSTPRPRAMVVLVLGGLIFLTWPLGAWDSFHRPHPAAIDLSEEYDLPSVLPYVGMRVTITGEELDQSNGDTLKRPSKGSWESVLWFKDAGSSINLTSKPPAAPEGLITATGILSATPSTSGVKGKLDLTLHVDTWHFETFGGTYDTPVPFSLRETLDSFSVYGFVLALLLIPLWLRCLVVVIAWRPAEPPSHRCPCCGYDCRGSPQRCSECGTRVGSPNFRLNLNPKLE